jgi:hypothetical protein
MEEKLPHEIRPLEVTRIIKLVQRYQANQNIDADDGVTGVMIAA